MREDLMAIKKFHCFRKDIIGQFLYKACRNHVTRNFMAVPHAVIIGLN